MIRRNHVVRVLERMKVNHPEHASAIQTVLDRPELLSQAHSRIAADVPPMESGSGSGTRRPVVQWLLDHWQLILSIVLAIVGMFVTGT